MINKDKNHIKTFCQLALLKKYFKANVVLKYSWRKYIKIEFD